MIEALLRYEFNNFVFWFMIRSKIYNGHLLAATFLTWVTEKNFSDPEKSPFFQHLYMNGDAH